MTSKHVMLKSRTGAVFTGTAEIEDADGSLVILTADGHGYRSAHRDRAAAHFGHRELWCMNRLTWVNLNGVRVVLTRWNTQAYRKGE